MSRDKLGTLNPVTFRCAEPVRESIVDGIRTANIQTLRKESKEACRPSVFVEKGTCWVVPDWWEGSIFSWLLVGFERKRWRVQSYNNEREKMRDVKASEEATIVRTIVVFLMSAASRLENHITIIRRTHHSYQRRSLPRCFAPHC